MWNVVSETDLNGYYIMGYSACVTLVTAKNTTPVVFVYARAYRAMLFHFLPSLAIARRLASSPSRDSSASSFLLFPEPRLRGEHKRVYDPLISNV